MSVKLLHNDNTNIIGCHGNQTKPHRRNDFTNQAYIMDDPHLSTTAAPSNGNPNGHIINSEPDESVAISVNGSKNPKDSTKPETEDTYRSLLPFCVVFGIGSLLSQGMSMYLSSQVTVIEKAFGLSSLKSGFLLSANDIGFVTTVLFASHFLKNRHIPRILAGCVLIFGISGMLVSVPHFISDEHTNMVSTTHNASNSSMDSFLCVPGSAERVNSSKDQCSDQEGGGKNDDNVQWMVALIAVLMMIQGVAKSPRQPLSSVYIDNNSSETNTGFYIGILTSFTIFGPFMAITAGGLFSKIPVDLKATSMNPDDPRWIGAWWLGFVVFGGCAVLMSIPIFFIPASLRKMSVKPESKPSEYISTSNVTESKKSFMKKATGLPRSIIRVLSQPIYVTHVLATLFNMFSLISLSSFGPKYMENQFRIPTWKANIILGVEKLATTTTGTLAGGIIARRLKLGMSGCVKMIIIVRFFGLITQALNFIFGCDNPQIVGYDTKSSVTANLSCQCLGIGYLPVCADGQTYFNPCYAGCQTENKNAYTNCAASASGVVDSGICDTGCNYLVPFVAINALSALVQTTSLAPTLVVMLRSVKEPKDRAMGFGVNSFLLSLLVFLPGPILFGKLFDSVCLVWNAVSSCGERSGKSGRAGACALYDVRDMRMQFIAIDCALKVVCLLCSLLTLYFAKKRLARESEQEKDVVIAIKPPVPNPRTSTGSND